MMFSFATTIYGQSIVVYVQYALIAGTIFFKKWNKKKREIFACFVLITEIPDVYIN